MFPLQGIPFFTCTLRISASQNHLGLLSGGKSPPDFPFPPYPKESPMRIPPLFFTLSLFVLFTFSPVHAEEVWKITSLNWEPYSGAEMASQGNSIQKLREVLKKEGIRLVVEFYPWARAQHLAATKEYVGFFPAWPEEVGEGFVGSSPVDWSEIGLLKRSGETVTFQNMDELFRNYKVGLVGTYTYPKEIEDAAQKYPANADRAPHEVSLLQKLSQKRHPVAITDPNVMMFLAEKNGIHNVEPVQVLMKKELVVAFRNGEDNKARRQLLEKILKNP